MQKSQKFKSRKTAVGQARRLKLRRASSTDVINRRSKVAARQMVIRKLLKGRDKKQLSAAEKDRIEKQASNILAGQKGLVVRMIPKIRSLERSRLAGKKK
jgi:RNA polymerase-interacting CarD/CdnL/TRCF family regulator